MKITVNQLLEQGLPRANGGMLKLRKGQYEAEQTEHGLVVSVDGQTRTIPTPIVEKLKGLGLITVGA